MKALVITRYGKDVLAIPLPVAEWVKFFETEAIGVANVGYDFTVRTTEDEDISDLERFKNSPVEP